MRFLLFIFLNGEGETDIAFLDRGGQHCRVHFMEESEVKKLVFFKSVSFPKLISLLSFKFLHFVSFTFYISQTI